MIFEVGKQYLLVLPKTWLITCPTEGIWNYQKVTYTMTGSDSILEDYGNDVRPWHKIGDHTAWVKHSSYKTFYRDNIYMAKPAWLREIHYPTISNHILET